jgi:hypothetical protein
MCARFWEGIVLSLLVAPGLLWAGPWLAERLAYWRAPVVDLHLVVTVYPPMMRLTNEDSFEWADVRLVLNAHGTDPGYTWHVPHVSAGAQVVFTLEEFTTPDGQAFNPRRTKAFVLGIEAGTPHGRGRWAGRLD